MAFKGIPTETVIAIRHYVDSVSTYLDAHAAPPLLTIAALFQLIAKYGGPALDAHIVSLDAMRTLFSESRNCVTSCVTRPVLSPVDQQILAALRTQTHAISMNALQAFMHVPHSSLNQRLLILLRKRFVERTLIERLHYWQIAGRALGPSAEHSPVIPGSATLLPSATAVARFHEHHRVLRQPRRR